MAGARELRGWLGRLLWTANAAAAVGACCYVLLVFVAPESMSSPAHADPGVYRLAVRGRDGAWILPTLAALLLVADFLWLVYGPAPRIPTTHVVSDTPGGPVRVSREAIETGLRGAAEALDEISRVRVAVESIGPLHKKILVRASFLAPDGVAVQVASQRLRDVLRRRFAELVQLPDGIRLELEIEFAGFQGRLSRRADEAAAAEEPAEAPFTGPRYPIDDDPVAS